MSIDTECREDNIYFARLSEQGERYEDMIKFMKKVAKVSLEEIKSLMLVLCSVIKSFQTTKETC